MREFFYAKLWGMAVYAERREEVDPYHDLNRFRSRDTGFNGDNGFWAIPSPEPQLPQTLLDVLCKPLSGDDPVVLAARTLACEIAARENPMEMLFVAILRAGVPVADWLVQLLPGSVAVATSLFVGYGIDRVALRAIQRDYPGRKLVFVDGWTGKGGVADELCRQGLGPLAVLCDPWGVADYRGSSDDILSPSACFTGPTTLGFSRTFTQFPDRQFAAYRFSPSLLCDSMVTAWKHSCPLPSGTYHRESVIARTRHKTPLRIHSNEVCRAMINSQPEVVMFADPPPIARKAYSLLIELADALDIPQRYDVTELSRLNTRVACALRLKA